MSKQFINQYYNQVHGVRRAGASNEGAVSSPFYVLLVQYAQAKKYLMITEFTIKSPKTKKNIRPDGILMNELRVHRGYWESKDEFDDLDYEINKKIHSDGYIDNNILFEDSQTAVLIQQGQEVMRVDMQDADKLHQILTAFIDFKPAEIVEFEKALEAFKKDIPQIANTFRNLFDAESRTNQKYIAARNRFLDICKVEINPDITEADVREMLIQHILTEDLFTAIFDDATFLKYNVVANELENLINVVITRAIRQNQLGEIRHYYQTLNATAAAIADHHEKQKFLKIVYENFYKVYNPAGADRLGVVYTPNEIVRFMVESTDALLEKHFGKSLSDKGVQILDPATGTGTFITDIIDFIPPQYLEHKYKNELFANEVSILPYYIANLNIEYTYKNKMGKYAPFENICFVDTLDNIDGLKYEAQQGSFFGFSSENAERIKKQNEQKISVIIGNPPYNAKQANFNNENANRKYPHIDKKIKDTFIKHGTSQNQIAIYDMYTRFYRWAMDRLDQNGIISFITNSSFINSAAFDGFRKCIADDFNEIWIVDMKGNARNSGEQRQKEGGNIFDDKIRVGVAICFLIKNSKAEKGLKVRYFGIDDYLSAGAKIDFVKTNSLFKIPFERITPDKNNWINLTDNNWDTLLPIMNKDAKAGKEGGNALFKLFSRGVASQRDAWVYDFSKSNLENKMRFFVDIYEKTRNDQKAKQTAETAENTEAAAAITFDYKMSIKWDSDLESYLRRNIDKEFKAGKMIKSIYRPYVKQYFYFDKHFNGRLYQWENIYNAENKTIAVVATGATKDFHLLATDTVADLHFTGDSQCLPLYRYTENGERVDNITDWGLAQFREHYKSEDISKVDIFHYTYAVLHCGKYRQKYELNLKREFPRLPFYVDFAKWAAWGAELMALHIGYESAAPYVLTRVEAGKPKPQPAPKLKADKENGVIVLDENTQLTGIPAAAWAYKLGNRSALEWVLDQYKESKIADPTIAEKFDTYRFADYKDAVIDLLMRLCTVSVRTVEIMAEMDNPKA
jgi:predicted helicase